MHPNLRDSTCPISCLDNQHGFFVLHDDSTFPALDYTIFYLTLMTWSLCDIHSLINRCELRNSKTIFQKPFSLCVHFKVSNSSVSLLALDWLFKSYFSVPLNSHWIHWMDDWVILKSQRQFRVYLRDFKIRSKDCDYPDKTECSDIFNRI